MHVDISYLTQVVLFMTSGRAKRPRVLKSSCKGKQVGQTANRRGSFYGES